MRTLSSLVLFGSSLVAAGCARQASPDLDSAAAAVDSSDSVESEGNVMMAVTDGADMTVQGAVTSDQVALRIAANVALRWQPSSCATVSSSGSTITIKYNDCTGPRGLLHVTGELDLTVSIDASGAITVAGKSNGDLQVNRASIAFDVTANYSVSGTMHSLAVTTNGDGTGPLGNTIDHDGQYTINWDTLSQCGSIDGTWSTEFSSTTASATRSNQVNLMRCAGGCPTGTVVHTGLRGATLTLTFDGTNVATWSASTGASGSVNLPCQ
jgi:hypothetical protein